MSVATAERRRILLVDDIEFNRLMDLDLPGIGGHETAAAIQGSHGRDQDAAMKVVALSSRRGIDARLRSRDVGMSAPIARPIGPRQRLREIEQVFVPAPEDPDPWDYTLYEEWVARLGAGRMHGFLIKLQDQLRTLLAMLIDTEDADDLHRRAHDAASTGGMMGFMEITRGCRAFLEASDAVAGTSARTDLTDALERAILRLDRHLSTQQPAAKTQTFDN